VTLEGLELALERAQSDVTHGQAAATRREVLLSLDQELFSFQSELGQVSRDAAEVRP
jgi:hypothetical protein